ncbi:hypothetical protein DBV15_03128 [Temnothorax longispinosus]|uniref:Uncharacterized protein n=1 Tax=Temnothorax longispinosus TaxID=300112 RepID=A0A4S2KN99_9HYME|nr:hypothetical protein DBV15_03128 [Temnothorax longispinosus]
MKKEEEERERRYVHGKHTLGEEPLAKMSAAVENGVDPSKPRGGVFSRAFAKRAQPYEEGESDDSFWSLSGRLWCFPLSLPPLVLGKINIVLGFKPGYPPYEVSAGNSRHLRAYLVNDVNQSRRQNIHGVPCSDASYNYSLLITIYVHGKHTLGEEPLAKMSAAVENGVDPSKPRGGVFSRAFAKRAQPYEEGESDDSFWSLSGRLWCFPLSLPPLVLGKINIVLGFKPGYPPYEVSAGNSRHLRAYLVNDVNQSRRQNIHALKTLNRLNKEGEALALQNDLTTNPTLALMRRILADAQD